jgi:hypothetical protein
LESTELKLLELQECQLSTSCISSNWLRTKYPICKLRTNGLLAHDQALLQPLSWCTPSGAMLIPVVELEERPFFTFVDLGTSRDSRSGEVKGERKEPALSSGDTESLSPSSGLSFLMCLRILASALDPELQDSVRPASNPTSHNNGQQ